MDNRLSSKTMHHVGGADDLLLPGDFYIRDVPIYNSEKQVRAIVFKCPYCGMDMMSTIAHTIILPKRGFWRSYLDIIGLPNGITVSPKIVCPFSPSHSFSIKRGRIVPTTKNG